MNKLIDIAVSTRPDKKLMAIFSIAGKEKIVHFGSHSSTTYIEGAGELKKMNYLKRHNIRENWDNPFSAGSLSKNLLWGPTTSLIENIALYKRRFDL
jgi:hypothetical protein